MPWVLPWCAPRQRGRRWAPRARCRPGGMAASGRMLPPAQTRRAAWRWLPAGRRGAHVHCQSVVAAYRWRNRETQIAHPGTKQLPGHPAGTRSHARHHTSTPQRRLYGRTCCSARLARCRCPVSADCPCSTPAVASESALAARSAPPCPSLRAHWATLAQWRPPSAAQGPLEDGEVQETPLLLQPCCVCFLALGAELAPAPAPAPAPPPPPPPRTTSLSVWERACEEMREWEWEAQSGGRGANLPLQSRWLCPLVLGMAPPPPPPHTGSLSASQRA